MTSRSFPWLVSICLAVAFGPMLVQLECNVCQDNGVACVNLTSFHLCYGSSTPNTDQLFTCNDGLECTDLPSICYQSSTRPASCDISSCGVCNDIQKFACTSRSTFALCFGALYPSDVTGTCPDGKVCDASSEDICVESVQPDSIICYLDEPASK